MTTEINIADILKAKKRLEGVVKNTPIEHVERLSERFGANVYVKREDLQKVRSYKIRGAYNFIKSLSSQDRKKGVVCASAGNHGQGVAFACNKLGIKGYIFMPEGTPKQKRNKVLKFGNGNIEMKLVGKTYDEAGSIAKKFCKENDMVFVHPFDDVTTIAGQAIVAVEILNDFPQDIDYVFVPVGGGGLLSGVGSYFKKLSPNTKIIGVEACGSASMKKAIDKGEPIELDEIDTFADGVAVRRVGDVSFEIANNVCDKIICVPEGRVCLEMLELYQNEGIIAEPAGALSLAGIDFLDEDVKGKNIVCILSGGNNDISRYPEVIERSLVYQNLKHYFIIDFTQKPGELKNFVNKVLGPTDDISRFEYIKKTNKESGPALVGIEVINPQDIERIISNLEKYKIGYEKINSEDSLYRFLV